MGLPSTLTVEQLAERADTVAALRREGVLEYEAACMAIARLYAAYCSQAGGNGPEPNAVGSRILKHLETMPTE